MAHQADLRYITMCANRFADLTKVRLSVSMFDVCLSLITVLLQLYKRE